MVGDGVTVGVLGGVWVAAAPHGGWFLAAAGYALRVKPGLMVDWG